MKRGSWLYIASLVAIPAAVISEILGAQTQVFIFSIIAILPLAAYIGRATEALAVHVGPRLGGFLNATFGNVTELIIATFLIAAGEVAVVKVSITGAIIGNLLLVLGASLLTGGLKYREQEFNAKVAGMHSASLALAIIGLMMPALFHSAAPHAGFQVDETISIGVATILIVLYVSSVFFSFFSNQDVLSTTFAHEEARMSKRRSILVLVGATVGVAVMSDLLVGSLEHAGSSLGLKKLFVGLIIVPLVGNAAEHGSAVLMAYKNKVDVALEIAVGSSTQIALFIAPLLVFISLIAGKPMDFFFSGVEIAAVAFSTAIVALISLDGRSNWLEGAQLLAAYLIIALSFFYLPPISV